MAFFSGREDVCFEETSQWIEKHLRIEPSDPREEGEGAWLGYPLVMRPAGDQRRDSIVKGEMVDRWIRGKRRIAGVFDDRGQVLDELWHRLGPGVRTFDVSNGVRDF